MGRNSTTSDQDRAYFHFVVYLPIQYGIARGLKRVVLGTEPYRPKVLRGGEPAPLWSLVALPGRLDGRWRVALRDLGRRRREATTNELDALGAAGGVALAPKC